MKVAYFATAVNYERKTFVKFAPGIDDEGQEEGQCQCYKTFYGRKLRIFVIS